MMRPLHICAASLVCAAGRGLDEIGEALRSGRSGLRANDLDWVDLDCAIGRVSGIEDVALPKALADFDCRNNRLAEIGLTTDGFEAAVHDAAQRYGPDRMAVVLGTSTSGIRQTEWAYEHRDPSTGALPAAYKFRGTHEYNSLSEYVRRRLALHGPASVVSTACSSSSKALVDAYRLIETGVCDAAVAGGVDTLCRMTLHGFQSLELLSCVPCRPNDAERDGISIGEAAGFALLERDAQDTEAAQPFARLLGYGESSDGYHMSTPPPDGLGAQLAMRAALERAGLAAEEIDYLNLHGTGTAINDRVEDVAVFDVFGGGTPCSSTKGWTGHPLGAAGIVGVLIAGLSMRNGSLPCNLNMDVLDPAFRSSVLAETVASPAQHVMANAFGFGGSNCSIVLGAAS